MEERLLSEEEERLREMWSSFWEMEEHLEEEEERLHAMEEHGPLEMWSSFWAICFSACVMEERLLSEEEEERLREMWSSFWEMEEHLEEMEERRRLEEEERLHAMEEHGPLEMWSSFWEEKERLRREMWSFPSLAMLERRREELKRRREEEERRRRVMLELHCAMEESLHDITERILNGEVERDIQRLTEEAKKLKETLEELERETRGLFSIWFSLEGAKRGIRRLNEKMKELRETTEKLEKKIPGLFLFSGFWKTLKGAERGIRRLNEKMKELEETTEKLEKKIPGLFLFSGFWKTQKMEERLLRVDFDPPTLRRSQSVMFLPPDMAEIRSDVGKPPGRHIFKKTLVPELVTVNPPGEYQEDPGKPAGITVTLRDQAGAGAEAAAAA